MIIQTSNSSKPEFREATNLLRGICALSVLLGHYKFVFNSEVDFFTKRPFDDLFSVLYDNGGESVRIFWMISGLILTHTYINQAKVSARNFLVARFARLYPVHLVSLLVITLLQQISMTNFKKYEMYGDNDTYHFLLNVFFIQGWGFEKSYSFNAPTWSVSVELAVYAIFFVSQGLLFKHRLGLAIGLLLFLKIFSLSGVSLSGLFFYNCLVDFTAGVVVFFIVESFKMRRKSIVWLGLIISFCLIFVVPARLPLLNLEPNLLKFVQLASIVLIAAQADLTNFSKYLRKIGLLGELSYSAFLWHTPILIVVNLTQESAWLSEVIGENHLFLIIYLVATYSTSFLSFKLIERPAQRYLRQKLTYA
jgi:peptidoglycan/LPS O-acetylase OafA/YrhL